MDKPTTAQIELTVGHMDSDSEEEYSIFVPEFYRCGVLSAKEIENIELYREQLHKLLDSEIDKISDWQKRKDG